MGIKGKLIGKVPMKQMVVDEFNQIWLWDFVDGKIHWIFYCYCFVEVNESLLKYT